MPTIKVIVSTIEFYIESNLTNVEIDEMILSNKYVNLYYRWYCSRTNIKIQAELASYFMKTGILDLNKQQIIKNSQEFVEVFLKIVKSENPTFNYTLIGRELPTVHLGGLCFV